MAFANFDNELAAILQGLKIEYKSHKNLLKDCLAELILWCNDTHTRMGQTSYYITFNIGLASSECARFMAYELINQFELAGERIYKPNIVFKVHSGVNTKPSDRNYDLLLKALKCTAKKMIPTYLLCDCAMDKSVEPSLLSVVGCRSRIVDDLHGRASGIGRGNIANISINLPRIALDIDKECRALSLAEKMQIFYKKWRELATTTKDILLHRYKKLCEKSATDFPTNTAYHLWCEDFGENLDEVFRHGTLSLGFIGLSEALEVLSLQRYYKDEKIYAMAVDFVKFMRAYCDELRNQYNMNFSLLATSGELISGRFIEFDEKLYKPCVDIFSKGFYTNSFHINVDSKLTKPEKLKFEGAFHSFCNGGCISYLELGEAPLDNAEGLYDLLCIAVKANVHYLGFNYPKDVCEKCGASGTFDECVECGSSEIMRIRRVSGYLEVQDFFTRGKKAEERTRMAN